MKGGVRRRASLTQRRALSPGKSVASSAERGRKQRVYREANRKIAFRVTVGYSCQRQKNPDRKIGLGATRQLGRRDATWSAREGVGDWGENQASNQRGLGLQRGTAGTGGAGGARNEGGESFVSRNARDLNGKKDAGVRGTCRG